MWGIYEHTRVGRQLKRLPTEVLKRYEKWKDIATISGPQGLRMIKGFHEESLFGKWKGHTSSRLNSQFRVIYRVESDRILIKVVSITAHDYRKR